MGKSNQHVVPKDGGWAVRRQGAHRVTKVFDTQGEAVILDVRTTEEVREGKFANSRHIPLSKLCKENGQALCDLKGLSKKKKIYIHCTTGARAEMAYQELMKRGYSAFFLAEQVHCEEGACTIDE